MDFGAIKDAAMLVLMFVVFGVPALALAARLAIRPVLDAIVTLRDTAGSHHLGPDPRLIELEGEVSRLGHEVARLTEAQAFHRQLTPVASRDAILGNKAQR